MRFQTALALVLVLLTAASCGKDPVSPSPTVTIACNGARQSCAIAFNASATISWDSTAASTCAVSPGGWTGTAGTQSTGPLTSTRTYEVRCTGPGGDASASVSVSVGQQPVPGSFNLSGTCALVDASTQRAALSWTPAQAASSYRVERRTWSIGAWGGSVSIAATVHAENVSASEDHYFRVHAVNPAGETLSSPAELLVCRAVGPPPAPPIPGGPGSPQIGFSSVPPIGGFADLAGFILHVLPADHKVVVYIRVNSLWWVKPTAAQPLTAIGADGSWVADITTGGIDETATQIVAFLVTNSHQPIPALGTTSVPISVNGQDVLAQVSQNR